MPSWLLLALVVLGFTLVVPLFVLGNTGGDWRRAVQAWKQFAGWLALLAAPGLLVGVWFSMFGS